MHKRKPKVNDEVVVFHDGELKIGEVTDICDVDYLGLTFKFKIKTKRKSANPFKHEYIDCELIANSFTLNPCVNANIGWAHAKSVGSVCFVFYTTEEYKLWIKNEYKYQMDSAKVQFERCKELYESDIDVTLSEFKNK
jgi:hypothetical protein